jgi:hypothetical protein
VDDKMLGATPAQLRLATERMHHVVLELPGYETSTVDLRLEVGEKRSVTIALPKKTARPWDKAASDHIVDDLLDVADARSGRLRVSTKPWSQVFEGTRLLGRTPLMHVSLPAGAHTLTFVSPGHAPVKREVRIDAGAELTLVFSLDSP